MRSRLKNNFEFVVAAPANADEEAIHKRAMNDYCKYGALNSDDVISEVAAEAGDDENQSVAKDKTAEELMYYLFESELRSRLLKIASSEGLSASEYIVHLVKEDIKKHSSVI